MTRRSTRTKRYVEKLKDVEEDQDNRSPLSEDDVTLVEADLLGEDAFADTGLNIQGVRRSGECHMTPYLASLSWE